MVLTPGDRPAGSSATGVSGRRPRTVTYPGLSTIREQSQDHSPEGHRRGMDRLRSTSDRVTGDKGVASNGVKKDRDQALADRIARYKADKVGGDKVTSDRLSGRVTSRVTDHVRVTRRATDSEIRVSDANKPLIKDSDKEKRVSGRLNDHVRVTRRAVDGELVTGKISESGRVTDSNRVTGRLTNKVTDGVKILESVTESQKTKDVLRQKQKEERLRSEIRRSR